MDFARKDCHLAIGIAKKHGAQLEIVEVMDRHLKRAKEIGGDNMDMR